MNETIERSTLQQVQEQFGPLHDAAAVASWFGREGRDQWTPEMAGRWAALAWQIALTLDAADTELHAEERRKSARVMVDG